MGIYERLPGLIAGARDFKSPEAAGGTQDTLTELVLACGESYAELGRLRMCLITANAGFE